MEVQACARKSLRFFDASKGVSSFELRGFLLSDPGHEFLPALPIGIRLASRRNHSERERLGLLILWRGKELVHGDIRTSRKPPPRPKRRVRTIATCANPRVRATGTCASSASFFTSSSSALRLAGMSGACSTSSALEKVCSCGASSHLRCKNRPAFFPLFTKLARHRSIKARAFALASTTHQKEWVPLEPKCSPSGTLTRS